MAFDAKEQEIIKYGVANGKSQSEVQQAIANYRLKITPQKTVQQPSFAQDAGQDLMQIGSEIKQDTIDKAGTTQAAIDRYKAGEQGLVRTTGQVIGQGAQYASNAINSVLKGVIKAVMPQSFENATKAGLTKVVTPVVQSDMVKGILEKYNSLDPKRKADLDAALGIVSLGLDVSGIGATKKAGEMAIETGVKGAAKITETGIKLGEDIVDSAGNLIKKSTNIGAKSAEEKALNAISRDILQVTPTERKVLLSEGKLTKPTLTKPAGIIKTAEEEATALKYKDLLQGSDIENVGNVSARVTEQDLAVDSFIKQSGIKYKPKEFDTLLRENVNKIQKPVGLTQSSWDKATEQLIKDFENLKPGNDLHNLYQSRKIFDKSAEILGAFDADPVSKAKLAKVIRDTAQKYIDSRIPNGVYKDSMKDMWTLLSLNDDILIPKALKTMTKSQIGNWLKLHPLQAKAIRTTGGLLKLGGVLEVIK